MNVDKTLGEYKDEKKQKYNTESEKAVLDTFLADVQKYYDCDRRDAVDMLLNYKGDLRVLYGMLHSVDYRTVEDKEQEQEEFYNQKEDSWLKTHKENVRIEDRLISWFLCAFSKGYDYEGAWNMCINTNAGRGILYNEDNYKDVDGSALFELATFETDLYENYTFSQPKLDYTNICLFVNFVLYANRVVKMPFEKIFVKMSVNKFLNTVGYALGDYDNKLIRTYLFEDSV